MKTKPAVVRNGKVEFWRFIFSVIIVIHHSRALLGDENCMFLGGSLAVEFFFLVSGYLMMASIEKKKEPPVALGTETLGYIGRKLKGLLPELLVAHVIALVFASYAKQYDFGGVIRLFMDTFFEVTQLKMSGLPSVSLNGATWYISSMLLCMAILYPLIRKFPNVMTRIVIPLIALFLLGYLSKAYVAPRDPLKWTGFAMKGTIRAMAELCLGVICFYGAKSLSRLSLSKLGKALVSAAEWLSYLIAIYYMYTQKAGKYDFFIIAIMMIGVSLTFSHQGLDAKLFDCKLFVVLGRWSLPLFLSHIFYGQRLNQVLPEGMSDNRKMAVYLCCSVVTAVFVHLISNLLRKCGPQIGAAAKRLLLKEQETTSE